MKNLGRLAMVLVVIFTATWATCSYSSAALFFSVEPPPTGEQVVCSEDGSACVDVSNGSLHWDRTLLAFGSQTTDNIEFSLHYVNSAPANTLFGTSGWRCSSDIKVNWIQGPPDLFSLTTPQGTTIAFTYDPVSRTWGALASFGVTLIGQVMTSPLRFIVYDKYGNHIDFNSLGKPIAIVDRLGRTMGFTYNPAGNLRYITDMWGRSIEFMYDATPRVIAIRDVVAGTAYLTFTYTAGYLTNVRSGYASGALFSNYAFGYDGSNRLNSYTDPDGVATSFGYSGGGVANMATDAATNTWAFTYNVGNTVFTDRRGNSFTYHYNAAVPPRITQVDWPAPTGTWGSACSEYWTYNTDRTVASYTTRAGEVYGFTYDSVGNLLTKSGPLSSNWVWTYTAGNLLSTATDPNSNVTNYVYDGSNRLWKIILPDDSLVTPTHAVIYTYNLNSQVSTKTDPNGHVETYTYDAYGNYASVVNSPDGGITSYTTTYTNNAWGMPTNIVNPRGYSTMYEYDTRHYNTKVKVEYSAGVYSETVYTHNASGSVATVTDPLTNVTEFSYDSLGRRYQVEHADGNFEQWGFDENGNTIWHQDSVTFDYNIANATSFCTEQYVYDTWNRCWQTGRLRINPAGGTPAFVTNYDETRFSADGNRTYYADYLGNVTTWVYDSLNRLDYETDPYTNHDDHTYDYNGNLLTFTDKNGNVWSYTYDALNRKVTEVAPLAAPNNTTTWGYDYNGNVLTITDRLGHVTTYDYDDINRLHSVTNDQLCCTATYQYDANGNRTRVTDAWLYYTDYTYSRQDRVLTITKPDTGVFTYEYDRCGNVTRTVDEEGGETRTSYDVMNRVYQVTHAYGTAYAFTTTTTYDANGRTSRFEDGVGNYTDTTYDPRSLTLETDYYSPTAGSTHSTASYDYDVQGNCTSVTDALSNTTTLYYDDMNRPYETVKPSGATFSKTFDPNGNVATETDGETNTTTYSYDAMNRCWRTTDAQSNNFDKTFDAMGNVLTEVVSPDGGTTFYTTTYVYDSLYKMTSMTDPLNHAHLNWFDTAGRLTNYIDRAGNPVDFTYNSCGRVTQIDHPAPLDPLTSMQTVMTYDLCGRMLTYTSPEIDKEFTYDVLGRKIQEDQVMPSWPTATTLTATFTYDALGRTTQVSDFEPGTGNLVTDYTYDDAALAKTVTETPQNGNPARVNTFQYDAAGNLTCKTVDSGMYEDYYYDTDNRMYYEEVVDSGNTVLGYQSYTFDDNSLVDSDVTTGCFGSYSTAYTYDSRRLLTAEVRAGTNSYNKGYTYDGMYCRTQKTVGGTATNYTYNDLGRITAATGGTAFTCVYDDNGNLTAKTTGLIVESYAFDWKNNLVRYQNSDTAEDMYYGYDIGSTRIVKARPEEGGGTYDVCADIAGWKHFFHKTSGNRRLYAESETDGANWWWTTQYTIDNYTGVGFIENVQTARTGFAVDIYSCAMDAWSNCRLMYDSSETCVLNAEYDMFLVETNRSGGYDLRGGMGGERNEEDASRLGIGSSSHEYLASDATEITSRSLGGCIKLEFEMPMSPRVELEDTPRDTRDKAEDALKDLGIDTVLDFLPEEVRNAYELAIRLKNAWEAVLIVSTFREWNEWAYLIKYNNVVVHIVITKPSGAIKKVKVNCLDRSVADVGGGLGPTVPALEALITANLANELYDVVDSAIAHVESGTPEFAAVHGSVNGLVRPDIGLKIKINMQADVNAWSTTWYRYSYESLSGVQSGKYAVSPSEYLTGKVNETFHRDFNSWTNDGPSSSTYTSQGHTSLVSGVERSDGSIDVSTTEGFDLNAGAVRTENVPGSGVSPEGAGSPVVHDNALAGQ